MANIEPSESSVRYAHKKYAEFRERIGLTGEYSEEDALNEQALAVCDEIREQQIALFTAQSEQLYGLLQRIGRTRLVSELVGGISPLAVRRAADSYASTLPRDPKDSDEAGRHVHLRYSDTGETVPGTGDKKDTKPD